MFTLRTWRLVALGTTLFALIGTPFLWSSAWASDSGKAASYQSAQENNGTEEPSLEGRVTALETQVAVLQTAVAELQGGGLAEERDDGAAAGPTPTAITVTTREPVVCGRSFGSWGAATADGVSVQLLQWVDGAEADEPVEIAGKSVVALEIALANDRDGALDVEPADFVVTDCDGETYLGMDGGVEPALDTQSIAPGAEAQGWVTFVLPEGMQAAEFAYRIQSPGRSGAEVSCPLVDREADPNGTGGMGGAGCSARGGSAG